MQKRNVLSSPRLVELKKNRQKVILNKILLSILGLVGIFFLLTYLSRLHALNVYDVKIVGNETVDGEALKKVVTEEISGKYLWLFPKTNIFIFPKNKIKKALSSKFKRLKDINLLVKGLEEEDFNGNYLEVKVTERTGEYVWCGDAPTEGGARSTCSFLDDSGYLFDNAPYFSGNVYFKFYGSISESYFFPNIFSKLISLRDTLVRMGLKPVGLYVDKNGDIKVLLSGGKSSTQPEIILKNAGNFETVIENLETALTTEPLQSKFKNKYSSLLYIDLRFGNKVYFKFNE